MGLRAGEEAPRDSERSCERLLTGSAMCGVTPWGKRKAGGSPRLHTVKKNRAFGNWTSNLTWKARALEFVQLVNKEQSFRFSSEEGVI